MTAESRYNWAVFSGRAVGFGTYAVMVHVYPTQPDWSVFYLAGLMLTGGAAVGSLFRPKETT